MTNDQATARKFPESRKITTTTTSPQPQRYWLRNPVTEEVGGDIHPAPTGRKPSLNLLSGSTPL